MPVRGGPCGETAPIVPSSSRGAIALSLCLILRGRDTADADGHKR